MSATSFPNVQLLIDGEWTGAKGGETIEVVNPATEEVIGTVAHARIADLDRALDAAVRGMAVWRATPAITKAKVFMKAAALLRERLDETSRLMVLEQGKTLAEAKGETERGAETIEWMAGEIQRVYGRLIEGRTPNVLQMVVKEPIGIVAAFTPWNFPINQIVRKVAGALAAGCALIVKGPEETPASCAELVRAFHDAGVPAGALNLVFGTPAEISEYLVPHPLVKKISFTGSTVVGKHLASLAGQNMKVATMELGGHAPVLVFADTDVTAAAKALVGNKYRNAGQTCISPTRFMIERAAFDEFSDAFVEGSKAIKVGNGLDPSSQMGALANDRRVQAMDRMVADAKSKGATLRAGGNRVGNQGYFFEPTVFTDVPLDAALMNEEPFGPIVMINPFDSYEDAITEANRLPYGLSAYAFTGSSKRAKKLATDVETGMMSINHFGLGIPETPFGGVKDSGYGFEGGLEAIEAYLQTRFITIADL